jgi:hypothetical protein
MKITHRCSQSSLSSLLRYGATALLAVLMVALPVASNAQNTTSAIRGKVQDISGNPVGSASVVVEDLRSGVERSITSNNSGVFLATRLLPGGPYKITVNGTKTIDVPSIAVGDTYNLTINLQSDVSIEEIVTIGQTADLVEVASGPSATFNLADIENSVSFSRDISDVYGIDPRLNIDNDEDGFGVNCAGKHPRFNNVTLDGVSQTDRFGLNENGYSTAVGMPFPFDAIEQIAVELAPFDVTYGSFSACNINAVTKSGTNDWEAKVFYEYSSDSLRGDRVADDEADYSRSPYDNNNIGFNIGGPIIQDKLFIFGAYEDDTRVRYLERGYSGSGRVDERPWLSQADFQRIESISRSVYGYEPGGQPGDGEQESEKFLVRLDWNINDDHNASLIYNYFDGVQSRDSDGDDNEFEFANHFYDKGAESETITAKLTSQWTDALSTEIFYSANTMDDTQITVGPPDFADMQISIGGRDGVVYVGADDSRQANELDTESNYLKLQANYLAGDHIITAGYDREELTIFNLFVQHSNGGEYDYFDDSNNDDPNCLALTAQERFDGATVPDSDGDPTNNDCNMSGIDRFELGRPSRIYYGSGGGTNNPRDAAVRFTNILNSVYIQDEIFIDHANLTITAGLRYEWFESDDRPKFNQAFTDTVGIRNDANIDGVDLLMPRIGFNWDATQDVTVRGGVGLYSGGNPNVWISNAWSNDGITNAQFRLNNFGGGITVLPGDPDSVALSGSQRPGYDVPQSLVDDVLAITVDDAQDENLAFIDPDYKQPREWKYALGATWDMPWGGIQLDADYLHTRGKNPAYYKDMSQDQVGTTVIGTPIYDYVRGEDNFMLTNSTKTPVSNVLSLVAQKSFDNIGLDVLFGYAYTDAEDVSPMTSSVAGSNFSNLALSNLNDPSVGTSNYVVPQRFTLRLNWERALFGDTLTQVTVFGFLNEGQPQSYAMNSGDLEGDGFFGRHLLYVPSGPSDPNVVFDPSFDQAAFFQWVEDNGLAPGLQPRNGQHASWSQRWDLRVSQEVKLPGNFGGRLYLKVYNLGNMLNDDWGKVTDAQFFTPEVVATDVDSAGRFVFTEFNDRPIERVYTNRSLWEVRLGLDVRFGR